MPYKKKILYLHIGLHKTGTSAFQKTATLIANTPSLIYPNIEERVVGDYSHNILIGYMQSHRSASVKDCLIDDISDPLTDEMRLLDSMFHDKLGSISILLSAEEFASEFQDETKARQWQEIFSSFDTIRVAIVLRRYDHLLNSVASEIVKTSFHGNMFIDKSCTAYSCYDISPLLRIIRSFEWEVEIFSYDGLVGQQALIPQLLTWCGIAPSEIPKELPNSYVNRKFHRRKAMFCSLLNKKSLTELEKIALVKSISSCTAIVDDGEEFLYPPEELDDFYIHVKKLNTVALLNEGILDMDEFFKYEPLTPNIKWTSPRAPTIAEISASREKIMDEIGIDIFHICLDPLDVYKNR
jgi:hypothetical protein